MQSEEMGMEPGIPFVIVSALFGLLFGSFLNVCIYRLPRDLSVVIPRSFCPECGMAIAWYDNIPVLSYIFLRGKCRNCSRPIGIRYVLVELSTAVAFAFVARLYGPSLATLKWLVFEAVLITLFWTDLEERLLPDELTLGGTIAGFLLALWIPLSTGLAELLFTSSRPIWISLLNALSGAVLLAGPVWLLGFVYSRLRKRDGLGFGDVKLLVMFGVFLGIEQGLSALLIGSLAGSVIGFSYIKLSGKDASTYQLPFGSFLCAGAAIVPLLPHV